MTLPYRQNYESQLQYPFQIVEIAKCRVGLTKDPEKHRTEVLPEDERSREFRADQFKVVKGPLPWPAAVQAAVNHAKGHLCEYDWKPTGEKLPFQWYVYHYEEIRRGVDPFAAWR